MGGARRVLARTAAVTAAIITSVTVAGCAPQSVFIVGDDAAFCQYSVVASDAASLPECRHRLDLEHRRLAAATATRIDGYALLNTPEPSVGVAERCKAPDTAKDCGAADVTGTIPTQPTR